MNYNRYKTIFLIFIAGSIITLIPSIIYIYYNVDNSTIAHNPGIILLFGFIVYIYTIPIILLISFFYLGRSLIQDNVFSLHLAIGKKYLSGLLLRTFVFSLLTAMVLFISINTYLPDTLDKKLDSHKTYYGNLVRFLQYTGLYITY